METTIQTRQFGDLQVSVFHDEWADCPCNWDLAALYLFEYSDSRRLHRDCNWKEIADEKCTLQEALVRLVNHNVEWKRILRYIKQGKCGNIFLRYDRSRNLWQLKEEGVTQTYTLGEYTPYELENDSFSWEILGNLDQDKLIRILRDLGKDIYVCEFSTSGYCQGDYCEGVAFCTKKRYEKYVSKDTKDWKQKIQTIISGELKCLEKWMWSDVLGYTLEEKVHFTKTYDDGTTVDAYEWQEIETVCGIYEEADEIFSNVISTHTPRVTA